MPAKKLNAYQKLMQKQAIALEKKASDRRVARLAADIARKQLKGIERAKAEKLAAVKVRETNAAAPARR